MITDDDLVTKFKFLRYLPGYFLVKDVNSIFQAGSADLIKIMGWKAVEESINKEVC